MSIGYEYCPTEGYILSKVTKVLSLFEVLAYMDSIIDDDRINQPFYELVDFSEIDKFDFGYYQSDQIYGKLKLLQTHKKYLGTCFVASHDLAKAMSNVFKVQGETNGMNMEVFNSVDDAAEYIKENLP